MANKQKGGMAFYDCKLSQGQVDLDQKDLINLSEPAYNNAWGNYNIARKTDWFQLLVIVLTTELIGVLASMFSGKQDKSVHRLLEKGAHTKTEKVSWIHQRSSEMSIFRSKLSMRFLKYVSFIVFVLYISYLVYLTFFDQLYGREFIHRSINIIPLKTVIQFLTSSFNRNIIVTNIAGNIIAFMPMGFLLPIAFRKLNVFLKVILVVLAATVAIEILQYITGAGATDIDDVILNLLGGVLGYSVYIVIMKIPVITSLFRNKEQS